MDARVRITQAMEYAVIREAVNGILKGGYSISVANDDRNSTDPEDHEIWKSTDPAAIMKALFLCDEEWLKCYKKDERGPLPNAWVRLIYGNDGWDVINDYTTNLDDELAEANRIADVLDRDPLQVFAPLFDAVTDTIDDIEAFDAKCTQAEHTDVAEAWGLMYTWKKRLLDALERPRLEEMV